MRGTSTTNALNRISLGSLLQNVLSHGCVCSRGVSAPGGCLLWGVSAPRVVYSQGVSAPEGEGCLLPGVSALGVGGVYPTMH